jgi:hypothetical protein
MRLPRCIQRSIQSHHSPGKIRYFMTKDGGLHVARGVTSGVSHAVKPTCRLAICCWRREKRVLQLLAARPSYCNWTHRERAQNRFFWLLRRIFTPPNPSPPSSTSCGRLLVDLADATPFLPSHSGRQLRELKLDIHVDTFTARRRDALDHGAISSEVKSRGVE